MNIDFARTTLFSCPALLDAVLEFNGAFHQSPVSLSLQNCPPVPGLDAAALWQQAASRCACSRWLPVDETFWDFSDEQLCVALLSAEDMVLLGTLFGAAVYARALRLVVLREDVLRWQVALGRDVWAYALGRGQYQAGMCADMFEAQDGVLSLHPSPLAQPYALTPARVLTCGWVALQALHHQWPEAVRRRVADKWIIVEQRLVGAEARAGASTDAAGGFGAGVTGPRAKALWPLLRKILHKELAPAWIQYFS